MTPEELARAKELGTHAWYYRSEASVLLKIAVAEIETLQQEIRSLRSELRLLGIDYQ